jgi:hypothetical protein
VKVDVVARLAHIWKSGVVVIALLATVVACGSSDSSRARNAALVAGTSCTKPGQVSKISKVSVVCATTNKGSLWYATMKTKGKAGKADIEALQAEIAKLKERVGTLESIVTDKSYQLKEQINKL